MFPKNGPFPKKVGSPKRDCSHPSGMLSHLLTWWPYHGLDFECDPSSTRKSIGGWSRLIRVDLCGSMLIPRTWDDHDKRWQAMISDDKRQNKTLTTCWSWWLSDKSFFCERCFPLRPSIDTKTSSLVNSSIVVFRPQPSLGSLEGVHAGTRLVLQSYLNSLKQLCISGIHI